MTIENGHLCGDFLINMVIFHSYVSLPEGTWMYIYILYILYVIVCHVCVQNSRMGFTSLVKWGAQLSCMAGV